MSSDNAEKKVNKVEPYRQTRFVKAARRDASTRRTGSSVRVGRKAFTGQA